MTTTTVQQLLIPPTDGFGAYFGAVTDAAGDLFVTTVSGGANGYGALIKFVYDASTGQYGPIPTLLYSFTPSDSAPGSSPLVDSAGNVIFSTASGVIYELTPSASVLRLGAVNFSTGDFVANAQGDLFYLATDSLSAIFYKLPKAGASYAAPQMLANFAAEVSWQTPAIDRSGNLYATTQSGFIYILPPGTHLPIPAASGLGPLQGGIAIDGQGNLFVADIDGKVYELSGGAALTTALLGVVPANYGSPVGDIAVDAAGNLFLATSTGAVLELAKTGAGYASSFDVVAASSFGSGSGVKLGADGRLMVVSWDQPSLVEVISGAAVCFLAGTAIRTPAGDVAVETLKPGDLVVNASGAVRPVRWVGHRRLDARRHPRPDLVHPVRISANAFDEGRPARDLCVSPSHTLAFDAGGEVLIAASELVNSTTVVQVPLDRVDYWHVELDSHGLLIAEGVPAESYLDAANRGFFAGEGVVDLAATPDAAPDAGAFCRPVAGAEAIRAVRASLRRRAEALGWRIVEPAPYADLDLFADGLRLEPLGRGRWAIPTGTRELALVSGAASPFDCGRGDDRRRLGVCVADIAFDGARERRAIALDDPRLVAGFHEVEGAGGGLWRWTDGRAILPAALWDGMGESFVLRLALVDTPTPRLVGPAAAGSDESERAAA